MFHIIPNLEQGSLEWLAFRRKHITATDSMKILEECPISWGNPRSLYYEKIMAIEKPINSVMQKGIDLEPFARSAVSQKLGVIFEPVCVVSDKHPWMMASLDGMTKSKDRIIEIKCGRSAHEKAKLGEVCSYYIPQIMHQLAITGHLTIDYCTFWNDELIILSIHRDEGYIQNLIEKTYEFYQCLKTFTEPKCTLPDYEEETNEKARMLAKEIYRLDEQKKELDHLIKQHKNSLQDIANGRNIKVDNLIVRKKVRQGSIDYSKIPSLQDQDLEEYRKPASEFYDFRFLKNH